MRNWLKRLFGSTNNDPPKPPPPPRREFVELIEALDAEGIECARDDVTTADMPSLVGYYFQLDDWAQKLCIIDLTCDQHHPDMTAMMKDVLRAPGEGDYVDLPKAAALGYLSEENDQFMRYYNDRELLRSTVLEVLEREGMQLVQPAAKPEPKPASAPSDPREALMAAARAGDVGTLRELLALGVSADTVIDGEPVLCQAIMESATQAAMVLLEAGANPNLTRETGAQSALWWAAGAGDTELVEALLGAGAELDARDQWGANALQQAASSGHVEALKVLLSRGGDFHTPYHDGRTVLNFAIRGGEVEAVAALLDAGADLQSKQSTFTPLAFACFEGTAQMVELLVARGADVDATVDYSGYPGATPLMFAAQAGKVRMIEALIAGGADPGRVDGSGRTAADYAQGKRADAVKAALGA